MWVYRVCTKGPSRFSQDSCQDFILHWGENTTLPPHSAPSSPHGAWITWTVTWMAPVPVAEDGGVAEAVDVMVDVGSRQHRPLVTRWKWKEDDTHEVEGQSKASTCSHIIKSHVTRQQVGIQPGRAQVTTSIKPSDGCPSSNEAATPRPLPESLSPWHVAAY